MSQSGTGNLFWLVSHSPAPQTRINLKVTLRTPVPTAAQSASYSQDDGDLPMGGGNDALKNPGYVRQ